MLSRAEFEGICAGAREDPAPLIESLFAITTKNLPGQEPIQLLKLNRAQRRIHEALQRQKSLGQPGRVITLKARQPGASTYAAARQAVALVTQPYAQCMTVAHIDIAAVGLFKKVEFMIERLPPELRPSFKSQRRSELLLSHVPCVDADVPLRTLFLVATAGGQEVWRSTTLTGVHVSELAFCPNAESLLLGILQTVPQTVGTTVILESTANGLGDTFHNEYTRAEAGDSSFVSVFIPWFDVNEYSMPAPKDFSLDEDEVVLKRAFGLTNDQLQWRRYAIHTLCGGSLDKFAQEYPLTAAEAFLVSGRPAFSIKVLREMWEKASTALPPKRGVMMPDGTFLELAS